MAAINIKRSAATILSPLIDDSSKLTRVLNGDDYINLSFSHDSFVEVLVGDYITWGGVTYTIYQAPEFTKKSKREYVYNLRFEGPQYALSQALFLLSPTWDGEFFLTGTAEDFVNLIVTNLDRVYGAGVYDTGSVVTTEFKNLSFNNEDCLTVLKRLCEEFELEYYVQGEFIHLSSEIGSATGLTFQYHEGLRNIRRAKVNDRDLVTRLFAFGSERNIDTDYGAKRLRLPSATYPNGYMEQGTETYGIREGYKNFDDIYPHFEGVVTGSSANNKVVDSSIDFDLNNYLIEGVAAKIVFRTGDLTGMEFEILSYNNSTKETTFKAYTEETGLTLPSDTFNPSVGDEFTFVDITMPAAYITAAEEEMETAATALLSELSAPNVQYEIDTDWHNLRATATSLDVGDIITITDSELTDGALDFRILEISQSLANQYKYTVKIGQSILIGYLKKMIGERLRIDRTVTVNKRDAVRNYRRGYLATAELQESIFDTDGYFDPDNIKPLSIETAMLTVGSKSTQLILHDVVAEPNYQGNANLLEISAGSLTHFTIEAAAKTWTMASGYSTILDTAENYYLYVKCEKASTDAYWLASADQIVVDPDDGFYYFLVGFLSTAIDGVRALSWLYGQTTINGGFIRTGMIQALDGDSFIDLDNGEAVLAKATLKSSKTGKRIEIDSDDNNLIFYSAAGTPLMTLDDDAWLGSPAMVFAGGSVFVIYSNASSFATITNGAISVMGLANSNGGYYLTYNPSNGSFTYYGSTSDIRLKGKVKDITSALDKISQLKGFTYALNKKGQKITGQDGRRQAGLSAQDIQKVLPEAVKELGQSGFLQVDYDGIIALLVEAIKEHREETEALKNKVSDLNKRLEKLEEKLT